MSTKVKVVLTRSEHIDVVGKIDSDHPHEPSWTYAEARKPPGLPEQGAKLLKEDDRIDAITWPEDSVSLRICCLASTRR